jgi:hypothetical protein
MDESQPPDCFVSFSFESQEKTQKVLDIWAKGNTFPSEVLARLKVAVKGEKGAYHKSHVFAKYSLSRNPRNFFFAHALVSSWYENI